MFIDERIQDQPAFQSSLLDENNFVERQYVLERLNQLCKQVSHNRKVKIFRIWYGCSRDLLSCHFSVYDEVDNSRYGKAIHR